jgi:hypothetical protein
MKPVRNINTFLKSLKRQLWNVLPKLCSQYRLNFKSEVPPTDGEIYYDSDTNERRYNLYVLITFLKPQEMCYFTCYVIVLDKIRDSAGNGKSYVRLRRIYIKLHTLNLPQSGSVLSPWKRLYPQNIERRCTNYRSYVASKGRCTGDSKCDLKRKEEENHDNSLLKVKGRAKGKKLSLCCSFNWAPRHEGVLGEWRYSSTHYLPRHYLEVSGQFHAPAALPPGKELVVPIG